MTTDLDDVLRTAAADLHLDRTLDAVLARGARLRRRRRGLRLCAGALALVAVGGVSTLVMPSGSTPLATAEAAWGARMVNLAGDDLARQDRECRRALRPALGGATDDGVPADATIVAADSRAGTSVLLYRYAAKFATCMVTTDADGKALSSGGSWDGDWGPLPAGQQFEVLDGQFSTPATDPADCRPHGGNLMVCAPMDPDTPVHDIVGAVRVADDVTRFVAHVGDQDVEARIGAGLAVFWVPDGVTFSDYNDATATAYAVDGTELDSGTLTDRLAR